MLKTQLSNTSCKVFIADMTGRKDNVFYYPDVTQTCGETQKHDDYMAEPVLVIEAFSLATEARDRTDKRLVYQPIPTLKEYALVPQDRARVELYRRSEEGWDLITYGAEPCTWLRWDWSARFRRSTKLCGISGFRLLAANASVPRG